MLARRCSTEGRTGHQGREGENSDGDRDGGRCGNEHEDGDEHEGREWGENGSGNGNENREESGGEIESGYVQSGNRGGLEAARGGATPTSNQQPQPQYPTPQRNRRIIRRTRAQR